MKKDKQLLAGDFASGLEYNPGPYGEAKSEQNCKEEEPLKEDARESQVKTA